MLAFQSLLALRVSVCSERTTGWACSLARKRFFLGGVLHFWDKILAICAQSDAQPQPTELRTRSETSQRGCRRSQLLSDTEADELGLDSSPLEMSHTAH